MKYLALLFFPLALSAQALVGTVDVHVHADPDSRPRSIDAIDLARLAQTRGMRALVFKNHSESTAALAYLVRRVVPGIEVFGGIGLEAFFRALREQGFTEAQIDQMARKNPAALLGLP